MTEKKYDDSEELIEVEKIVSNNSETILNNDLSTNIDEETFSDEINNQQVSLESDSNDLVTDDNTEILEEKTDHEVLKDDEKTNINVIQPQEEIIAETVIVVEEKKEKMKKKKKKSLSGGTIFLIVGLIIIALPLCLIAYLLITAAMSEGPIIEERFNNDLNPTITNELIEETKNEISKITNVESVDITLQTAIVKVVCDVNDGLDAEAINQLTLEIKDSLNNKLPLNKYFLNTESTRMYDLEISVYNSLDIKEEDGFIYYILNKSSNMEDYNIQLVSDPLNPDLANQLRKDVEERLNPTTPPLEDGSGVDENDPEATVTPDVE